MDAQDRSVRLTIPAKAEYITLGRLALTAIARVRPLSEETLSDLKLALTEACTNSVRHAYQEGRAGTVEIVYQIEPDRLVVEVTDDGSGFEPATLSGGGDGDLGAGGPGLAVNPAVGDEGEIGGRGGGGGRGA